MIVFQKIFKILIFSPLKKITRLNQTETAETYTVLIYFNFSKTFQKRNFSPYKLPDFVI